ncbi:hypothetical protein SLEP1_g36283 [Rubroshorea leprosula]|uniref:Uncharacterized protein n=1 Tax=Rubroshorea leprosula TaxID=152421 RepID=A0AAV5KR75_9ROSI|nr:hypothetical protein SLEP1_g36283 [Rubroshorea leprosula]
MIHSIVIVVALMLIFAAIARADFYRCFADCIFICDFPPTDSACFRSCDKNCALNPCFIDHGCKG